MIKRKKSLSLSEDVIEELELRAKANGSSLSQAVEQAVRDTTRRSPAAMAKEIAGHPLLRSQLREEEQEAVERFAKQVIEGEKP